MKAKEILIEMEPPDGGWGWIVVSGSFLINFCTRAIQPSFGLLFGDLLKQLRVETTGASLVMSTMDAVINFTGLIVGPLVRKYTYRKVAIVGAFLSSGAILLTVPANSILHITITFGVIGGIGFGLSSASSMIGVNDYFSKKIGQAVGISMAGSSVGFMLMPQIVRFLLDEYYFRSTMLILGALSLNAVVGACLFQPVSWYKKDKKVNKVEEADILLTLDKIETKDISESTYVASFDHQGKVEDEFDNEFEKITSHKEENDAKKQPRIAIKIYLSRISQFLDLQLLGDGVYLNIVYGLSISIVTEMNFKLIVPFFLSDLGFKRSEIAFALSSMAVSDICSRLVIPPIMDRTPYPRRVTFVFGLTCLAISQSCLTFLRNVGPIILGIVIIGFFHGITITAFPVVLKEYASQEKFPSVLGLSMVFKGIFIAVFGPLSGYLRDISNSYALFIHFQTVLMISVLVTWIVEITIIKYKSNKLSVTYVLERESEDVITETLT